MVQTIFVFLVFLELSEWIMSRVMPVVSMLLRVATRRALRVIAYGRAADRSRLVPEERKRDIILE